MNNQTIRSQKHKSPGLPVIMEDKQFCNSKGKVRFCSSEMNDLMSPKKKPQHKQKTDLYKMTSEQLKKSVQTDPFMRAKLQCLIKSSQKSLNKENVIKSPKYSQKNNLIPPESQHCMSSYQKFRATKQNQKISQFLEVIKQSDRKEIEQPKLAKYRQSVIRY